MICTPITGQKASNGGINMKYSNEFKRRCIEMYNQGKYPKTPKGLKDETFHHQIREWVRRSEKGGLESVQHKAHQKQWTPEEKLELVSQVMTGRSCMSVAEGAGIRYSMLYVWVRKYKMEGYEGLVNKKKGRAPKETSMMPKEKVEPRELKESEREELIRLRAENEYLKAETASLKKSMALRREREAARLKAKKQQRSGNSEKKDTD